MLHHVNQDAPSYIGIVFNGSPLFTGEAGSGESEIRRWILEKDWLVALVALPEQMFYNTGIQTYLWILSTHKTKKQKGKVMLFDTSGEAFWKKLPKAIGDKRRTIEGSEDTILRQFAAWKETDHIKIFPSTDFGYRRIQIDRPLRLNCQASEERLARLLSVKTFADLASSKKKDKASREVEILAGRELQADLLAALRSLPKTLVKCRTEFQERLKKSIKKAGLKPKKPVIKSILDALSERDETAEPVVAETTVIKRSELLIRIRRDELNQRAPEIPRLGCFPLDHPEDKSLVQLTRYESDNDLKDFENVPLAPTFSTTSNAKFCPTPRTPGSTRTSPTKRTGVSARSAMRSTSTATSTPMSRPVAEIDKNIRKVEKNILEMLKEVMG